MSILAQLLVVACYAILAVAAGAVLSQSVAGLPAYAAYMAAAVGFVVAVLSHEILLRRRDGKAYAELLEDAMEELDEVRDVNRDLLTDISQTREEMAQLCDVLESASSGSGSNLVRELSVLQEQLSRLPSRRAREQAAPTLEVEPAVEPEPVPVPLAMGQAATSAPTPAAGPALNLPAVRQVDDAVLAEVRDALSESRIDLYLQPVVSLPQRKTRYHEAFSRLRTADDRLLTPAQYLDYAVQAGLISTIDNLLLFRCVQLVRRHQRQRRAVSFFINISTHTLHDTDFLQQFADFLEGNRNLANSLVFEFAQRDVAAFSEPVRLYLTRLARRDFRFSMDQVSSLDIDPLALESMGFAFVKAPAALLLGSGGGESRVHPGDLKELLSRSDIDLVAEKIESERQVVEILDLNVDFGQGYLFGEPRRAREEEVAA